MKENLPKPLVPGEVRDGAFGTYCGLCLLGLGLYCISSHGSKGRMVTDKYGLTDLRAGPVKECAGYRTFIANKKT
jgi:hypothetical protein